jgi:hypothetical protein
MTCLSKIPPEIPDGEILYRYINPHIFPDGQTDIPLSIFGEIDLSCDWEKYQKDPFSSFHVGEGKTCIIKIIVCDDIRNPKNPKRQGQAVPAWHQNIIHDPLSAEKDPVHGANYAHSLIQGRKKAAVCEAIRDNAIIMLKGA